MNTLKDLAKNVLIEGITAVTLAAGLATIAKLVGVTNEGEEVENG